MNSKSTASHAADDAGKLKGATPCEVTDTHAPAQTGHAEQVSPAISLAISPSTDENYKIESDGIQPSNQSGTGNVPNCYKCKHRGEVLGDAHSSCRHPAASPLYSQFFLMGKSAIASNEFELRGNTHGVRSGWFVWPINFDPVWLEQCSLFEDSTKADS